MLTLEIRENNIAILYLNNPPLNLITLDTIQQLKKYIFEIEGNKDINVLIITSKNDNFFCVGSDINEFGHVREQVVDLKLKEENKVFSMIESMPIPVIVALNGTALGGGLELAMTGDIRILSKEAEVGLPEINLGVFPGSGGLYRLPKLVGMSKSIELMSTGNKISADEAYRIGLVSHIVEKNEVLNFSIRIAEKLATKPKESLKIIKQGVRKNEEMTQDEAIKFNLKMSDKVFKTDDCKEGIEAFFEKREPRFE